MPIPKRRFSLGFLTGLTALLPLVTAGCAATTSRAEAPSLEQIAAAADTLVKRPELVGSGSVSSAIEKLAAETAPPARGLAPTPPVVTPFLCGETTCVCADNVPEQVRDKWTCEGMGQACRDRGFVADFPCKLLPTSGITLCVYRKAKRT